VRWPRCGCVLMLAAMAFSGPAHAQQSGSGSGNGVEGDFSAHTSASLGSSSNPLSGTVDPEVYRLGPGDALTVYVWGRIMMTIPMDVGPDGVVFIPGIGPLFLSGLTLSEAREHITDLIQSRYRSVQVQTKLQRVRSFIVYLSGEVKTQGPVVAYGSSLPIDLLPDSVFTPQASRRNIVVRHPDGNEYTYDLQIFQIAGLRTSSDALRGGDIIYVPRATRYIGVWGGVARPGLYELGPFDRLTTMLLLTDGLLPSAFRDSALFVRTRRGDRAESSWVSLERLLEGAPQDIPLEDGDNLYVSYDPAYRNVQRVTVTGQVVKAGDLPIEAGRTRFSDAIEAARGFLPDADTTALRLIRPRHGGAGSTVEFDRLARLSRDEMTESEYETFRAQLADLSTDFRIEWSRVQKGDAGLDPILVDGDIIRVDRRLNTVRVDGQVRRPGVFDFDSGKRIGYYIELAGGFAERGARSKVRITRAVNGQNVRASDVDYIQPGDFIWVPERPDRTLWDHARGLITIAAQVATVIIAVRR